MPLQMKTWIGCLAVLLAMGCNERSLLGLRARYGGPAAKGNYGLWLWEDGNPRDLPDALMWLTRAAEAGDTRAMYNLAKMKSTGGLDKPNPEAVKWFRRGAEAGNPDCMAKLADAHRYGLMGLEKDEAQYHYWMDRARAINKELSKSWWR